VKMKTLRRITKTIAPRQLRRSYGSFDFTDATIEPDPSPAPEAVFDRITGPYGRRSGGFDEET
jgi:hypothetical protein